MDFGPTELALVFSGVVCVVGVANFRASSREREMERIEAEHRKELETREWRTEARGLMQRQGEDIRTVKTEQRELRAEVKENAEHIHDLSVRHNADVAELSGRIDRVAGDVGDLMGVMQGEAELDTEDKEERK